jgi:hypothetical protein
MSRIKNFVNPKEDWLNSKWRPVMGWMYMIVCIFDFIIFPILWSGIQAVAHGQVNMQWQPITLQGAGLFHIAMGAILGIAVYGRTQEKINGAAGGFPTSTLSSKPPEFNSSMNMPNKQYNFQPAMMQRNYSGPQPYSYSSQNSYMNYGGSIVTRPDPNAEGFRPTVRRPV